MTVHALDRSATMAGTNWIENWNFIFWYADWIQMQALQNPAFYVNAICKMALAGDWNRYDRYSVQAEDLWPVVFVRELNTQTVFAKTDLENVAAIKEISSVL
jgi:hypothetical protein